jgi:acid phosphatase class B
MGREEKIDTVAKDLEKNFHLIGSTAIEDKL